MKKINFLLSIAFASFLSLSLSITSQVTSIGSGGNISGTKKCHHNATTTDNSSTEFCYNSMCENFTNYTGNTYAKCGT